MRLLVVWGPALVVGAVALTVAVRSLFAGGAPVQDHRRRAVSARERFRLVTANTQTGPLRDRLEQLMPAVDAATDEALRVAEVVRAIGTDDSGPALRLDQLVTTLERAVLMAGELSVAGPDGTAHLIDELDSLQAALRELGQGDR